MVFAPDLKNTVFAVATLLTIKPPRSLIFRFGFVCAAMIWLSPAPAGFAKVRRMFGLSVSGKTSDTLHPPDDHDRVKAFPDRGRLISCVDERHGLRKLDRGIIIPADLEGTEHDGPTESPINDRLIEIPDLMKGISGMSEFNLNDDRSSELFIEQKPVDDRTLVSIEPERELRNPPVMIKGAEGIAHLLLESDTEFLRLGITNSFPDLLARIYARVSQAIELTREIWVGSPAGIDSR